MEVMLGVFFINGGRHLIDIGVCGESVAEFHAIIPSAPSCCDGCQLEEEWQDCKNNKEGFPPIEQQYGGKNNPNYRQRDEQPQTAFIDDIEYFKACRNFHYFSEGARICY